MAKFKLKDKNVVFQFFFSFSTVKSVSIFCIRNKQLLVMMDDFCCWPFLLTLSFLSYLQIEKRSIFDNTHLFYLLGDKRKSTHKEIFLQIIHIIFFFLQNILQR